MNDEQLIEQWLLVNQPTIINNDDYKSQPWEGPLMQSETIELDDNGKRIYKHLDNNVERALLYA